MKNNTTTVTCICGAEMKTIHSDIWDASDLGCYWLECPECRRVSTPAITLTDAIWYWRHYKASLISSTGGLP